MGWAHIILGHGAGAFESLCNVGGNLDCDEVNTSRWSELFGVPISFWALPIYGVMAWLVHIARSGATTAPRARRALILLAGWNMLVSLLLLGVMATELGVFCLFCLTLDGLNLAILVLVLLPAGDRRPGLPDRRDMGSLATLGHARPHAGPAGDRPDRADGGSGFARGGGAL
jgi:uncharacterized membrane protein